jgi:15-cis-phytoene synthase
MSAGEGSKDAAAFCADLVRSHDFARYAATLFVPPEQRRALLALYAFNTEICRVREQVSQPLPGEVRLRWWTDMLGGEGDGGAEGNPVAAELLLAIRLWSLPTEPLSRLIDEHQFDLYNDPMPTLAALEGYLTDTSSALFALAARIGGSRSGEVEHLARHAGLAQGFSQVIAALPRDASRRQLFVPQQLLQKHGSGMEEVFAGKQTPNLRAAFGQLISEARQHLDTALTLLANVPAEVRPIFLPLATVRRDLAQMSRADADPFVPQVTSRFSILWTLWRASRSKAFSSRAFNSQAFNAG